jgi:hypothetical protein
MAVPSEKGLKIKVFEWFGVVVDGNYNPGVIAEK